MNETFEKLCKKHSLSEHAKVEFRNLFEKEIIKVFNRKSIEMSKEPIKESIIKKITTAKTKSTSSDGICSGKKADGKPCTFKAKENGYCGRHNPDKSSSPKAAAKPRVKKESKHDCHATIPKTGKNCIQPGTVKPDGSDFYYCKRHSEKWIEFEPEQEQELATSEVEETEETAEAEEEQEELKKLKKPKLKKNKKKNLMNNGAISGAISYDAFIVIRDNLKFWKSISFNFLKFYNHFSRPTHFTL
jgi:hypothetical protein